MEYNPKISESHFHLGIIYGDESAIDLAKYHLQLSQKTSKDQEMTSHITNLSTLIEKNPNEFISFAKSFYKKSKKESIREEINELLNRDKISNPEKVIELASNVLKYDESDDRYYYLSIRGLAYFHLGQHSEAIEDFTKSISVKPKAYLYNRRGFSYKEIGKKEKAIEDYDIAIKLNPKNSNSYSNRGDIYFDLKKLEKALKDYN